MFAFWHNIFPYKHTKYSFKSEISTGCFCQSADKLLLGSSSKVYEKIEKKFLNTFYQTQITLTKNRVDTGFILANIIPGCFILTVVLEIISLHYWLLLPAMIFAAIAGYVYGRRKTQKPTAPPVDKGKSNIYMAPVWLNRTDRMKELMAEEKPFIQKYDMVTVLFADIEGFTEITDSMPPEVLLDELNSFFFYFDTIIDRYHIEKIKTMGDAYMCAGGLPQKNQTNPVEVVLVALEVQNYLQQLREQNPNIWLVRIGIHTGQVIAGMLGHKKLSFDIWGHTVNLAARLESSCQAGKINISETTYGKIKHFFDCEYQGVLPGNKEVSYYVKGLKPEFVGEHVAGQIQPNREFGVQMQLLRLGDLEEYVESAMTDTNSTLLFHNFRHVLDVYEQVELLGHSEDITDEDLLLLKTTALLHDIGYSIAYDGVQTVSEDMAREALMLFRYDQQQIETVCRLMKASHYETKPNDILEQIIHDANMMYYGRADFITRMMNLFREQQEHHILVDKAEWMQNQIDCLASHRFYTQAAEKFISVSAEQQMANVAELLPDRSGNK